MRQMLIRTTTAQTLVNLDALVWATFQPGDEGKQNASLDLMLAGAIRPKRFTGDIARQLWQMCQEETA